MPRQVSLLILDDDRQVRDFFCDIAEELGFRVSWADDFHSFDRAYGVDGPDILLIDLTMPEKDGIEYLHELARRECRGAVILTSGQDEKLLASAVRLGEALGLRMADQLSKPVPVARIEAVLSRFLPQNVE